MTSYSIVLSFWICLLTHAVASDLPLRVVPACADSQLSSPASTITTTTATITTTKSKNSTVLILFQSVSLPPSSKCRCNISSESSYSLHQVWHNGDIIIRTPFNDTGGGSSVDPCKWSREGQDSCRRTGSEGETLALTLSGDGKSHPGSIVLLSVNAQGSPVTISCSPTDEVSTDAFALPTTVETKSSGTSTADSLTSTVSTISDYTSGGSSALPTSSSTSAAMSSSSSTYKFTDSTDKVTNSTGKVTDSTDKVTDRTDKITDSIEKVADSSREGLSTGGTVSMASGSSVTGPSFNVAFVSKDKKSGGDNEKQSEQSGHTFMYVGIGLTVFALMAMVAMFSFFIKKRREKKLSDTETSAISHRLQGQANSKGAALGNSRLSLISDRHNYEEVSDDGLSGLQVPKKTQTTTTTRKASNPNNYSHINSNQGRPPTIVSLPPNARPPDEDDDNDDYNKLDLARSTRLNSCRTTTLPMASGPAAKTFYVGDEVDDYMEVGDDGVYEAVDGAKGERTPLCPRKDRRGKEDEYMDCMSREDGRICLTAGKANPAFDSQELHVGNTRGDSSQKTTDGSPLPPTSHPPCTGLRRSNSRSMDNVTREAFRTQRASGHRYSKSMDLNLDRCRQRDLFLQNFRSQGDGADVSQLAKEQVPAPADYTHVSFPTDGDATAASDANRSEGCPEQSTYPWPTQGTVEAPLPDAKPTGGEEQVVLRKKPRNSKKSLNSENRMSMVEHMKLKELNTGLLELETAVRHSMEIHADELVMIDNILYGTLPRNRSLPTTEL